VQQRVDPELELAMREGLEETLTVLRLGLGPTLRMSRCRFERAAGNKGDLRPGVIARSP